MTVEELAEALGAQVVQDRPGPVRCLALVLEPSPEALREARRSGADTVLLHRSWGGEDRLGELGAVVLHDGLDDRIVPWLCARSGVEVTGPLGDVGVLGRADARALARALLADVGGCDRLEGPRPEGSVVAVVAALRPALVDEASAAGAGLYVTGQWRPGAAEAVARTGLTVLCLGHERLERWALGELARRLRGTLPGVDVVVP